jgi:hypothetical protein
MLFDQRPAQMWNAVECGEVPKKRLENAVSDRAALDVIIDTRELDGSLPDHFRVSAVEKRIHKIIEFLETMDPGADPRPYKATRAKIHEPRCMRRGVSADETLPGKRRAERDD